MKAINPDKIMYIGDINSDIEKGEGDFDKRISIISSITIYFQDDVSGLVELSSSFEKGRISDNIDHVAKNEEKLMEKIGDMINEFNKLIM